MQESKLPTFGVLLASGLVAGVLAFRMSRRKSHKESLTQTTSSMFSGGMKNLGDSEAYKFGREFMSEKFVPEMKPVLLDLLKEVEHYVNDYFRKAEKAVKSI